MTDATASAHHRYPYESGASVSRLLTIVISALTAILVVLTSPAAAVAEPSADSYHLVFGSSQLSAADRQLLAQHQAHFGSLRAAIARPAPSTALAGPPDDLKAQCAQHYAEAESPPKGWIADRFRQCVHGHIDGIVVRDDNGGLAGEITFEYWFLTWASANSRQVQTRISIDAAHAIISTIPPNFIDWPNQHIDILPLGCLPSEIITCPIPPTKTLNEWSLQPDYDMFFTSPDGSGAAPDNTVSNYSYYDWRIGTLPVRPTIVKTFAQTNMRFDSGRRQSPANGAVIPDFTPTFALSLTDRAVNESAVHIRDAQDYPLRTFPSWPGKTIPGKAGGKEPLHRLIDDALQTQNRNASIAFCKTVWGPDYPGPGPDNKKQCDEYPFASTYEGAVTGATGSPGAPRLSVRVINGSDNGNSGTRLGVLYAAQRLVDSDAFYVAITP